jgi:general L-amino acid transport system permease protein
MATSARPDDRPPFYRDTRFAGILVQGLFLVALLLVAWFIYSNMMTRLAAGSSASQSLLSWGFLDQTAGFGISEGIAFRPEETYRRAYVVGLVNTLRVSIAGIIFATLLGLFAGIARVSRNWLLNKLASIYIDVIRNTPLLVQLLFWYVGVITAFPDVREAGELGGLGFITNRGLYLVWPYITQVGRQWVWWLLAGIIVGFVASWLRRRRLDRSGVPGSGALIGLLAFVVIAAVGFFVTNATASLPEAVTYELDRGDRGVLYVDDNGNGRYDAGSDTPMAYVPVTLSSDNGQVVAEGITLGDGTFRFVDLPAPATSVTWQKPLPVALSEPERQGFNFRGGISLTPEFAALLLALVVYTGAFIAEIVRAGINAVPQGQWEASRAVGLSTADTLSMIVLPQALRVIIPPLTSQYLNLVKNSSLAIAVGYPDLFNISRTISNQTGAEVQTILLVMATYLAFSLITSLFMNWYNRRVALVER